jgi:hypothetical protein
LIDHKLDLFKHLPSSSTPTTAPEEPK